MIRRTLLAALPAVALTACAKAEPPPSAVGGPFTLIDQDGRPVTEAVLQGKWSAVFFGFTYCPDFCPTTLASLKAAKAQLAPKQQRELQVIFVSVDPARDTPAALKAYLADDSFPTGTLGLTGSAEQVAAAAKAYRAYYARKGEGENYLVDHSTAVYLMDPKGRFVRVLAYGLSPEESAGQIRDAMRQYG